MFPQYFFAFLFSTHLFSLARHSVCQTRLIDDHISGEETDGRLTIAFTMPVMVWDCCQNCNTLNEIVLLRLLDEDGDSLQRVNGAVMSKD